MRIDEDKIFGAYLNSLLVESKKAKKESEKDSKKESDSKKKENKKGKLNKLPPGLRKHMMKRKGLKESVNKLNEEVMTSSELAGDGDENVNSLEGMTVQELMNELELKNPELYHNLEAFLSGDTEVSAEDEIEDEAM